MLQKVVCAGTNERSFAKARNGLQELAERSISDQRVRRATVRIGNERVAERTADVARFEALPLPERRQSPVAVTPQAVAIEMDGGRIQIRDRHAPSPGEAIEVDGRKGRFWREAKVGVLMTLASRTFTEDPCPTIPQVFVDPRRFLQIYREIKGAAAKREAAGSAPEAAPASEPVVAGLPATTTADATVEAAVTEARRGPRPGQPVPLVRSVVATRQDVHGFGQLLVTAAWLRGFLAAKRKAFLGDGLEQNWTVWKRHFSDWVPILDLVHGLCYVYAGAMAGRPFAEGWPVYCQWAQWGWNGEVTLVIAALRERQSELGLPTEEDSETSPRQAVADSLRYLENQQTRMNYAEYRRQGLPLTTVEVESTIKQINFRTKGTEKFWSEGGEALLQLSADYLSETEPLNSFWLRREQSATGQRHYAIAP